MKRAISLVALIAATAWLGDVASTTPPTSDSSSAPDQHAWRSGALPVQHTKLAGRGKSLPLCNQDVLDDERSLRAKALPTRDSHPISHHFLELGRPFHASAARAEIIRSIRTVAAFWPGHAPTAPLRAPPLRL